MAVIEPSVLSAGRGVEIPKYENRVVMPTVVVVGVNPNSGGAGTPPPTTGQLYPRGTGNS